MNRLAREHSPYLLQHAGNPVDWFAWGDDAFEAARTGDKPIFLSIGYSTCHWCHVMEHESFENREIATVLNEEFVSIKVDREERPDVDRVYMTFVQGTTGSGGWPMSVWLTSDLKPFYGGTYFPPAARWGRPGFIDILRELARVWRDERDKLVSSAESVTQQMRTAAHSAAASTLPDASVLPAIVNQFTGSFDASHGGFGGAPKFPRPSELLFLLREHARTGETVGRDMAVATLRAIALGGMRDHIGGGFHRYSVDAAWRVPHFEKMLYDQAQLVLALVEGAQASGDPFLLEVAEDTLRYVMREMTGPEGGFYSAEDADSVPAEHAGDPHARKSEGAFYLWRSAEIDALLGDAAPIVKRRFGVEPDGNAPVDPHQEFTGRNLLYVAVAADQLASEFKRTEADVDEVLARARLALFRQRLERPHPHLDDKVLTAWNGLMIAAFARVARVVQAFGPEGRAAGQPYLDAARRAASFVRQRMWNEESRTLLRRFRAGDAQIAGYAEDYAFLVFGLLELFQADPDAGWLTWAIALQQRQDELFWDADAGGWFSTTGTDPSVLMRMKDDYDGAEPTASAVSAMNLLLLSHVAENPEWTGRIERTLSLFGVRLREVGRAVPMMACAFATFVAGVEQIVIVGAARAAGSPGAEPLGGAADDGVEALRRTVATAYRPFAITTAMSPEQQAALAPVAPFLATMRPVNGAAAAYVCRDFTCRAPVTTPEELEAELAGGGRCAAPRPQES
jgi:uncharacterized protein YyaL (SSP411 family)